MQQMKEKAANVAASSKSGMEKAKAAAQEKVEKMTTRDPIEKEMTREKKEARVNQAEFEKQQAREQNAAARQAGETFGCTTTGTPDYLTGSTEYGTGHPTGGVTEGVVGSQNPAGEYTGTGRVPLRKTGAGLGHPEHGTGGTFGERGL